MPYYHLKRPPPKRLRRQTQEVPPETIYLSTATLVVVPDTLIQQWTTEILKHVQDNVLNYTVISKPTQPLPSLHDLMKTDILLLSHSRFAKEDDDGCFEERGKNNICRCFPSVFGHPCRCQLTRSPLMRIQWKRLIIDEGHILGQGTTRLVSLAGKLRVERRWCVTGTVSNHMMGMELGMSRTLSTDINGNITPPNELPNRKTEQLDLKRLGNILVDFLHMPPFYNVEIWNRYVVKPYTENIHGAMSSLRSIMTLMIRHRPGDIEMDVKLPPLHTKTVLLEPTKLNRISMNVITAMIANNAVLTQRCDQDYMFHASQIKYRDEVIRNSMLSTFHFTATSVEDVLGGIRNAEEGLEKQVKRGYSKEDVKMLEDVVTHLKEALDDDEWRSLAVRNEPGSKEFSPQEMGTSSWDIIDFSLLPTRMSP
jgi:SNF2-related domain